MEIAISSVALFFSSFGIIFLGELPDKTLVSSILLARTFSRRLVFFAASSALFVQSAIAATVGSLLAHLPTKLISNLSSVVFIALGLFMIFRAIRGEEEEESTIASIRKRFAGLRPFWLVFVIVFVAEIGDITQVVTLNLVAHYHRALLVGLAGALGMTTAVFVAMVASKLTDRIDEKYIELAAAVILIVLGIVTLIGNFK
ncbi:MAG: TMEM165/GDT1 family protein [Actinomycetota bacterium]|nr:TMEM165/GDT1 family protein [Actinomycetota bacterium]